MKKLYSNRGSPKPINSSDYVARNLGMLPRTKKEIEAAAAEEAALQD